MLTIFSRFIGKIWCTGATQELCRVILPDSGRLLEEEAEYANRKGSSKHKPALPLYRKSDAIASLRLFSPIDSGEEFEPIPGLMASFRPQGHILGAAAVTLRGFGTSIGFSGNVGRPHDPVMPAPMVPDATD